LGAPLMTSSEDAKAVWNTLVTDTTSLNADITAWYQAGKAKGQGLDFVNAWTRWRDAVYSEYKDNMRRKVIPDSAWGQVDRGVAKMKDLKNWRAEFEKFSGQKATAPTSKKPTKASEKSVPPPNWVTPLLIVGGLFAGAALVNAVRK
jgi:hypothetical protein